VEHFGEIIAIWEQVLEGSDRVFEGRGLKAVAGESFDAEIVLTSLPVKEQNFILAVIRDVTDRKRAEQEIRNALHEKEAMLRELHHRVKNNFAVISSLLNLQRRRVKDAGILAVLNETAFRIRCMGMVHEKLHQSESLKELSVREYLYGLLTNLREAYEGTHPGIALDAILEDVSFGVDKAIPVGFLTSELVSNAYKHAFPEGTSGTIRVALRPLGDSTYELVVADDGVGMPPDLDLTNLPSLGIDLVLTFSKQLGGKLGITNRTGTTVRIEFAV
jgi:two-component sensor histidine kinase